MTLERTDAVDAVKGPWETIVLAAAGGPPAARRLLVFGTISGGQRARLHAANAWRAALAGGSTLTTEDVVGHVKRRGHSDLRPFETVEGGPVILSAVSPHA